MNKFITLSITSVIALLVLVACSTTSNNAQAQKSAKVHTELAGLYYQRGQLGVALDELTQALNYDSNYAPAYNVRGLVNMALHEDKQAEADFLTSLRLNNNDSDTHNNYGWFLCQRGREQESIPQYLAALKDPLYATPGLAYMNAGVCSLKAGNSKDAEDYLQRALLVQPDLKPALYALAELEFAKADYFSAKRHFADFSRSTEDMTAEQLWLGIRINRKVGDHSSEASYSVQLRNRFPDTPEAQKLIRGE